MCSAMQLKKNKNANLPKVCLLQRAKIHFKTTTNITTATSVQYDEKKINENLLPAFEVKSEKITRILQ